MKKSETNCCEAMELPRRPYHLQPYEEAVGLLVGLKDDQGSIIAKIGRENVMLPEGMKETLEHHLGMRIAILRTDLPDRPYLLRVLQSDRAETRQIMSPGTQICEALI